MIERAMLAAQIAGEIVSLASNKKKLSFFKF
jgi:hypothetical protein